MIILVVHLRARPGASSRVLDALRRMERLVEANEPGCTLFRVCRAQDDEDEWLLFEQYIDEASYLSHRETQYFQEIVQDELGALLLDRTRRLYTSEVER